jgi:hypothetical protein
MEKLELAYRAASCYVHHYDFHKEYDWTASIMLPFQLHILVFVFIEGKVT